MKQKAFTLIELLVVISIISLLSSVVLTSVGSARQKARDTRRIADMQQLGKAIQYYFDATGSFPPDLAGSDSSISVASDWSAAAGSLRATIVPSQIPALPKDPLNNATYNYTYEPQTTSGRTTYCLYAVLERTSARYRIKGGDRLGAFDAPCNAALGASEQELDWTF